MSIIGVVGAIGSGKSFTQLKVGLEYANERRKQLVCNFLIDRKALLEYASQPAFIFQWHGYLYLEFVKLMYAFYWYLWRLKIIKKRPKFPKFKPHLPWIVYLCKMNKGIIQIPNPRNLQSLLIPESVCLLDEAGIFLNSREFQKTPRELLADLCQSRKFGADLMWCAQFDEQVDKQMRMLTQYFVHCSSLSIYDRKLRRPSLKFKRIAWFTADAYFEWSFNPRVKTSFIKTFFAYSIKSEFGFMTPADYKLFKVFDSFERLDLLDVERKKSRIFSIYQCHLD